MAEWWEIGAAQNDFNDVVRGRGGNGHYIWDNTHAHARTYKHSHTRARTHSDGRGEAGQSCRWKGGGRASYWSSRRDQEEEGGAGLRKLDFFRFGWFLNSSATDIVLVTLPCTAVETAIVQCASRWAMARGHRLNTSLFWRRSTVSSVFFGRYLRSSLHSLSLSAPPPPPPTPRP